MVISQKMTKWNSFLVIEIFLAYLLRFLTYPWGTSTPAWKPLVYMSRFHKQLFSPLFFRQKISITNWVKVFKSEYRDPESRKLESRIWLGMCGELCRVCGCSEVVGMYVGCLLGVQSGWGVHDYWGSYNIRN